MSTDSPFLCAKSYKIHEGEMSLSEVEEEDNVEFRFTDTLVITNSSSLHFLVLLETTSTSINIITKAMLRFQIAASINIVENTPFTVVALACCCSRRRFQYTETLA